MPATRPSRGVDDHTDDQVVNVVFVVVVGEGCALVRWGGRVLPVLCNEGADRWLGFSGLDEFEEVASRDVSLLEHPQIEA